MKKVMKTVSLGISGIVSTVVISIIVGHPPRSVEQIILYAFPGGILMFFIFDPLLNAFTSRAENKSVDKSKSINEIHYGTEKQSAQQNNPFSEKIFNFMTENTLSIGTLDEFRKGQKDFSTWGNGVVIGSKELIVNKLSDKLLDIGAKGLNSIGRQKDYGWQKSKLERFTLRIEVTIPPGLLTGYYIGRIDDDLYGLFGYGFDHNEGIPEEPIQKEPIQSEFLYDSEKDKQLNLEHLFWYGFNKIVLNSSTVEEITTLLGPSKKKVLLNYSGKPIGYTISYKSYGIEFHVDENFVLKEIILTAGWHGKTEDGDVRIGSSLATVNEIKRTNSTSGKSKESNVYKFHGIGFNLLIGNSVATPRGKKIYSEMSFYFDTPISNYKRPFPDIPIITQINLRYSGEDKD
jgi:hypothetical protein